MKRIGLVLGIAFALSSAGCLGQIAVREPGAGGGFEVQGGGEGGTCSLEWKDEGLCLSTEWIEKPSADKKGGDLLVKFWRPKTGGTAAGPYVTPSSEIAVELWMPEHGHGSDVEPQPIAAVDEHGVPVAGVFNLKPIHFIMRGKWEIRIGGAVMKYKY